MIKKTGNFFEAHIEKIVLILVGLLFAWLFFTRVVISPNRIEYDRKMYSASKIDQEIVSEVQRLQDILDSDPNNKGPYQSRKEEYLSLVESSVKGVDLDVYPVRPGFVPLMQAIKRKYRLPIIGELESSEISYVRGAAYIPVEEVDVENPYSSLTSEVNDIDLVCVEGTLDMVALYDKFYESFVGDDVKAEWRDPCLAKPVFGAVQLERQHLQDDGIWSDWQPVDRSRVEPRREMFTIVEDVTSFPAGGMPVRLLQLDSTEVRSELLQPSSYSIASSEIEWLPPSLSKKKLKEAVNLRLKELRERREAERAAAESAKESRRRSAVTIDQSEEAPSVRSRYVEEAETTDRYGRRSTTSEVVEKTVEQEYLDILLSQVGDLRELGESLVFWAHDDSVEEDNTYRYRIRLGVLNPIAGTDQFAESDIDLRNQALLWSDYSEPTESVYIPKMLYFFPLSIRESAKTVTVQVSRYMQGYWYSEEFTVRNGEDIGRALEYEVVVEEDNEAVEEPVEIVDYSTGAFLVDFVPINEWTPGVNSRERHYFDMLYSYDGKEIEHLPISLSYWPRKMKDKFGEIKRLTREPKLPLRSW
jgi:hypothetical protein